MKTIVLTGGGTAGHVTPNLALLPQLLKQGYTVHYIGSKSGIEKGLVEGLPGVTYHGISSGKLRRYRSVQNLTDPFRVVAGFFQSLRLVRKIKPNIVFSKGGFVAVPVVMAAFFQRVPVISHESDLTPGLANRINAKFSKKVATTFPECAKTIGKKGVHTGTPMRESLFLGQREKGLALSGFTGDKPVLLMMGGSQGAQAVNEALRAALPQILPQMDVLHLCGQGKMDEALLGTPGYFQVEYLNEELPDALAACDLALSRAGATAIGELRALHKPMLLVPYPMGASRGDQIVNAENYRKNGFALVLPQEEMTGDSLAIALFQLKDEAPRLKKAMQQAPAADGSQAVLSLIEQLSLQ